MPQRLTKSRFKLGCECPTKLFYASQPQRYPSTKDSPFIDALARGGYQVGELAKLMHPGGVEVKTLHEGQALHETAQHLDRPEVTVFEAAIGVPDENLFVRVDVLKKTGTRFDLVEVKAKSWDSTKDALRNKKGTALIAKWHPYLLDVAFQAWVLKRARPDAEVFCHLMLANKAATCTVDGLHQRFLAHKARDADTGKVRLHCELRPGPMPASQGGDLLITLCVDAEVSYLHEQWRDHEQRSFAQLVGEFGSACASGQRVQPTLGAHCKGCEFRPDVEDLLPGQASGLVECWLEGSRSSQEDLETEPLVLDLWNNRLADKQIDQGVYLLRDVDPDSLSTSSSITHDAGLSTVARQVLQIERARDHDETAFVDVVELQRKIDELVYPLHFVDFETATVAIPFSAGRRPYEQMAFQFSHHVMHGDGRVVHQGQYLDMDRGFPNYRFVRELAASLGDMGGTFVHFAAHENTVMCQVRRQLLEDPAPVPDRDRLVQFLQAWASPSDSEPVAWQPTQRRVDLLDWILKHFYDPAMRGSNSIKAVLPAVMQSSTVLEQRYGKPIYGTPGGIPSLNFHGMQWFVRDTTGVVRSPYEMLGPVFADEAEIGFQRLFDDEGIREGGAAMTAYMRMQYEDMASAEREAIRAALLRYCELDTLAMVMVFEHLKSVVGR